MKQPVKYSIVVPVFNEEEVLGQFYVRVTAVMEKITEEYEIIFVNDGSVDKSLSILKSFNSEDKKVRIICLSRNFGHQTAITAGLEHAAGEAIIVMDADLQDSPDIIPEFIEKWKNGFKVVYGIRKRNEIFIKKIAYSFFYKILRKISDIEIPEEVGDFSLMDRVVVDAINSARERNRFVRGLRSWVGYKQAGVEYNRPTRAKGEPKYTLIKLIKLALDGFFAFSWVPLRLSSFLGFGISIVSLLLIIYGLYAKIFLDVKVAGWASLFVAVLFVGGIQLIILGILGEYIARIYEETKQRPLYVIKEIIE